MAENYNLNIDPELLAKAAPVFAAQGVDMEEFVYDVLLSVYETGTIPFDLLPSPIPCEEDMTREEFDALLEIGYQQAMRGEGIPIEEAIALLRSAR